MCECAGQQYQQNIYCRGLLMCHFIFLRHSFYVTWFTCWGCGKLGHRYILLSACRKYWLLETLHATAILFLVEEAILVSHWSSAHVRNQGAKWVTMTLFHFEVFICTEISCLGWYKNVEKNAVISLYPYKGREGCMFFTSLSSAYVISRRDRNRDKIPSLKEY